MKLAFPILDFVFLFFRTKRKWVGAEGREIKSISWASYGANFVFSIFGIFALYFE